MKKIKKKPSYAQKTLHEEGQGDGGGGEEGREGQQQARRGTRCKGGTVEDVTDPYMSRGVN